MQTAADESLASSRVRETHVCAALRARRLASTICISVVLGAATAAAWAWISDAGRAGFRLDERHVGQFAEALVVQDDIVAVRSANVEATTAADCPWRCVLHHGVNFTVDDGLEPAKACWRSINTPWVSGYTYAGIPELGGRKVDVSFRCSGAIEVHTSGYYSALVHSVGGYGSIVARSGVADSSVVWSLSRADGAEFDVGRGSLPRYYRKGVAHFDVAFQHRTHWAAMLQFSLIKVGAAAEPAASLGVFYDESAALRFDDDDVQAKIACLTSSACWTQVGCQNWEGLDKNTAWGLCHDWLAKDEACLVYSVGISTLTAYEIALGERGCEVVALDCTVSHPTSLGENVIFKPWCISAADEGELAADEMRRVADMLQGSTIYGGMVKGGEVVTLAKAMERMGHAGRRLTILKLDCEGCEWRVVPHLSRTQPIWWSSMVDELQIELHVHEKGELDSARGFKRAAATYDALRGFASHFQSVNRGAPGEGGVAPSLRRSGVLEDTCCYEHGLVNRARLSSKPALASKNSTRSTRTMQRGTYFANSAMARKIAALMKSCGASCQEMSNTFGIHHQLTWGSVSEQCRELWHKWACKTVPM